MARRLRMGPVDRVHGSDGHPLLPAIATHSSMDLSPKLHLWQFASASTPRGVFTLIFSMHSWVAWALLVTAPPVSMRWEVVHTVPNGQVLAQLNTLGSSTLCTGAPHTPCMCAWQDLSATCSMLSMQPLAQASQDQKKKGPGCACVEVYQSKGIKHHVVHLSAARQLQQACTPGTQSQVRTPGAQACRRLQQWTPMAVLAPMFLHAATSLDSQPYVCTMLQALNARAGSICNVPCGLHMRLPNLGHIAVFPTNRTPMVHKWSWRLDASGAPPPPQSIPVG